MDELMGMLRGGDDYITKPYQAPILLARIAAVLKRTGKGEKKEETLFVYKGVELDIAKCSLSYQGNSMELTKNEMKILYVLFRHAGEYVMRIDIIEYLWENQIFIDDNTLSVHVTRIREKLKNIGVFDFIETKRGMGYRI
ncbi:MAG: response regulator transcription factor [Lachnoclostridium sp.]